MPYGGGLLDDIARTVIQRMPVLDTALDIGAGAGRYGRMIRELRPEAHTIGVEIEPDYVTQFELKTLYDEILVAPASVLLEQVDAIWDLVTAGDVLEHMTKSAGVDLLHFLVYRTRYIWLAWPERYLQGSYNGYASEAHVSVWTEADLQSLQAAYELYRRPPLVGAIVQGYMAQVSLEELLAA